MSDTRAADWAERSEGQSDVRAAAAASRIVAALRRGVFPTSGERSKP